MLSFLPNVDARRATYLNLVGSIELQLRDAYARLYESGTENQTTIANKLGVGRSVINRRLTGQNNMTIETLADMVWALDRAIKVDIYDPLAGRELNMFLEIQTKSSPISTIDTITPTTDPRNEKTLTRDQVRITVVAS